MDHTNHNTPLQPVAETNAREAANANSSGYTLSTEANRDSVQTPLRQLASSLTITARNEPILRFLRKLKPDLSHLVPVFHAQGVVDEAHLEGLASMDNRDAWIYTWVKENWITEFQFNILINGLKARYYLPPASAQIEV
ncbi:hypothetical protein C8Q76DRAFT_742433 [Earliella scabrosa]|nr:hypothetical protein C8Q76DRAFT_742433 [Earliella scabrosa]